MRRPELLALACVGCTQVFDISSTILVDAAPSEFDAPLPPPPDHDRDGIPDMDDACIGSVADQFADFEGDAFTDVTDPCPFDYEGTSDPDEDKLPDDCDPFPGNAGDRLRCMMSFQNPTITRELWKARPAGTATWDYISELAIIGHGTGAVVAAEHIDAPAPLVTSLEAAVNVAIQSPATQAAATLWLRTNPTVSASDVGCELRGTGSSTQLTLRGAATPTSMSLGYSIQTGWVVLVSFAPSVSGRANVRCAARPLFSAGPATFSVSAEVALPAGTAGFEIESADARLKAIRILERDDLPAL